MGLLATRWEATFEGHLFSVHRNEVSKGFSLEMDGVELARRTWSWVGLGELHATAELKGQPVEVKLEIRWGWPHKPDGTCKITIDGTTIDAKYVR